jgi:hypothetical protein
MIRFSRLTASVPLILRNGDRALEGHYLGWLRKVMLWNICVLLFLKMVQVLVLRGEGISLGVATDYGRLSVQDALELGLVSRAYEFSAWNFLASLLGASFVKRSLLAATTHVRPSTDADRLKRAVLTLFFAGIFTAGYLLLVCAQSDGLTGTFFCTSGVLRFRALQYIEGAQNVLQMFLASYVLVYSCNLRKRLPFTPEPDLSRARWLLTGTGFVPSVICLSAFLGIRTLLPISVFFGDDFMPPVSTPPLRRLIFAIVVWYCPFWYVSGRVLCNWPSGKVSDDWRPGASSDAGDKELALAVPAGSGSSAIPGPGEAGGLLGPIDGPYSGMAVVVPSRSKNCTPEPTILVAPVVPEEGGEAAPQAKEESPHVRSGECLQGSELADSSTAPTEPDTGVGLSAAAREPAREDYDGGEIKRRGTVNQRMLEGLQEDPDRVNWSQREWALHLDCAPSAVAQTVTWKGTIAPLREMARIERVARDRRKSTSDGDD